VEEGVEVGRGREREKGRAHTHTRRGVHLLPLCTHSRAANQHD
jgi:hypothetical protein